MSNKPAATFRDGTLKATVWKNSSDKGDFYSVDLVRGYKDNDGNWKDSTSLSGSDLLRAANLLQSTYNAILNKRDRDKVQNGEENSQ